MVLPESVSGTVQGHPYYTRTSKSPRGLETAVYCGEEKHLAGVITHLRSAGGALREPYVEMCEATKGRRLRCTCNDMKRIAELVAKAWVRYVLRDPEYAYWREHRADILVDGDDDRKEDGQTDAGGMTYGQMHKKLRAESPRNGWNRFKGREQKQRNDR